MPEKRKRTPQEKKALLLARDRRNTYGESTTAARKNIPKKKVLANRKVRHAVKQKLETHGQDASDVTLLLETKKKWQKYPDTPLSQRLQNQVERRQYSHGRKVRAKIDLRKHQ